MAHCLRCGYRWTPRNAEVKLCPRCKSTHWRTKRNSRQGLRPVAVKLEGEIREAMIAIKSRDGITFSEQIRRALIDWIATDPKRVAQRKEDI